MDPEHLLRRFDGRTRLLLRSLLCGIYGTSRAIRVFNRQRHSDPHLCLSSCINALCQEEPRLDGEKLSLTPLVCLFPVTFKCGLLSFLHVTHTLVPHSCLTRLLDCFSRDSDQSPWTRALISQLCQDLGMKDLLGGELFTAQCRSGIELLCKRQFDDGHILSQPDLSLGALATGPTEAPALQLSGKRRNDNGELDKDVEEPGSQKKRRCLGYLGTDNLENENTSGARGIVLEISPLVVTDTHSGAVMEEKSSVGPSVTMPEHITVSLLQIKELLENDAEWDQDSSSILQVLNECEPSQVELLCEGLNLSDLPEQIVSRLCSALLHLSPDLSHSAAAILAKTLFSGKIASLRDPASRCLVTAMTSFCGRYPRPTCHVLIGPILHTGQINSVQAELLSRLIRDSLEPQYQLLVFGHTLAVSWSEELLLVIHTMLDSKLELPEESFSLFITHLCRQASHFLKSTKFAKMMLTVLTQYHSQVSAEHKHTLSCCLASHETFLKKSLLAALKRVTPT